MYQIIKKGSKSGCKRTIKYRVVLGVIHLFIRLKRILSYIIIQKYET